MATQSNLKKSLVDVPVMLYVFIRPDSIKRVFDVIKEARPSTLFLASDGPRDNVPTDKEKIAASRKVVEEIDWDCTVHKLYYDKNQGMYEMFKNTGDFVFKHVDRCILLEDDTIPAVSFFKYCEVLLEKYKDDLRIGNINGMNHLGVYEKPNTDYFFSKGGSIWGFAIWRRTYESFYDLSYGDDDYVMERLLENAKDYKQYCKSLKDCYEIGTHDGHVPGFEFFLGLYTYSQNKLNIVPTKNMMCNIGYGEGSTHNPGELKQSVKRIQKLYNMKRYELEFPLKHPKYVIEDIYYEKKVNRIMGRDKDVYIYRFFEGTARQFIYGSKKKILIGLVKRVFLINLIKKLLGK